MTRFLLGALMLCATAVARSAPDGHTLLISSNTTFTVNAALEQQLPYDPQKDFESIGLIGSSPLVLLAHPGVKAGSLKEVLERIERVTSPEPARAAGIMSARSLPELGAVTLRHPIATGEVSPVELLEACIARIGRLDPAVNAICATDHDRARAASREVEAAVTRGDPLPLLHGLPLGVKDLQATAGLLTTRGNVGLRGRVPTQDMSQVARLRRAGAIERRFADDPTLSRPRPDLDALAVPRPESKSVVTHPPLPGNGIAPMRPRSAV